MAEMFDDMHMMVTQQGGTIERIETGVMAATESTLCGVLTQGVLDHGNGKARIGIFRYPHEVRTGKTSSVCNDLIGFDNRGKLVNYAQNSLEEMVEKSTKLVTLIDLAGDAKYQKTTIHGLTGYTERIEADY